MDSVAVWSPQERADLFNEVGARRNLQNSIVEKDFWVCWALAKIFALPDNKQLLFKGGTSLSKAYNAIRRFSEDIDLSFNRAEFGYIGDKDPKAAPSGKKAGALIEALGNDVSRHIADSFVPALASAIETVLGPSANPGWSLTIDPDNPHTVNFRYPASLANQDYSAASYINPVVRLELGARSDHWPAENCAITSYAAEDFPQQFQTATVSIATLALERTLWEKATILHAEYHRPLDKMLPPRLSRHYHDLAALTQAGRGQDASRRLDLLDAVRDHKQLYFRSAWAGYDSARAGTLRLVPHEARMSALQEDYKSMRMMMFDEPPPFKSIIEQLRAFETAINEAQPNAPEPETVEPMPG